MFFFNLKLISINLYIINNKMCKYYLPREVIQLIFDYVPTELSRTIREFYNLLKGRKITNVAIGIRKITNDFWLSYDLNIRTGAFFAFGKQRMPLILGYHMF